MSKGSGSVSCGWCMDNKHSDCKVSIKHYDTIWYCKCKECYKGEVEETEEEIEEDEATL